MTSTSQLPDLAQALGPLLQRVPVEHQPLLIAAAERMAAERYRSWADSSTSAAWKSALLACADREEEIARRVESLYPDAPSLQKQLLNATSELAETGRAYFAPYSMDQQFVLQARGERLGAATWRSFAKRTSDTRARDVFLACAILEEQSAKFLESIAVDTTE
jgi:hypothetical protein